MKVESVWPGGEVELPEINLLEESPVMLMTTDRTTGDSPGKRYPGWKVRKYPGKREKP